MKDALSDLFAAAYVKAIIAGVATLVYNSVTPESIFSSSTAFFGVSPAL